LHTQSFKINSEKLDKFQTAADKKQKKIVYQKNNSFPEAFDTSRPIF